MGTGTGIQLKSFGEYVDSVYKRLTLFPYWLLQAPEVDLGHQVKGFSSKLLQPMFDLIEKKHLHVIWRR